METERRSEVGNENVDFRKNASVRKQGKVGEPITDFALKFMHAWGEAGKPVVDFSLFRLQ